MDWTREFPGLTKSTYLDSCAHGLLPRRTRAAIERHLQKWEDAPNWAEWNAAVEEARRAFARLIGAQPGEVAVMANATNGIAAVMNALQPGPRKEIVTCDLDFPTAPFLAERQRVRGLDHVHLGTEGQFVRAEQWRRLMGKTTALACIPAVASFTGYRFDVAAFAEAAHDAGAPLLVDAFQAAGTYPLDVKKLDVDFLVTGTYKWLLSPPGIAFLYVRRDHHAMLPTTSGWTAAATPYKFDPFEELAPDARRFQYGGHNILGSIAFTESARLLEEVGLPAIERRSRALVERIVGNALERKFEVLTPDAPEDRASIVTFRVPDAAKALDALARERVVVNPRLGGIRVSPHFYNSEADVDRLFEVLDSA